MSYSAHERNQVIRAFEEAIKGSESEKVPYLPMNDIEEIIKTYEPLKSMGIEFKGEHLETIGWQLDFWQYFFVDGVKYCLAGSWYYGNYTVRKD